MRGKIMVIFAESVGDALDGVTSWEIWPEVAKLCARRWSIEWLRNA